MGREALCRRPVTTRVLLAVSLLASIATSVRGQPAVKGQWSPVFDTQNVIIHAHVLQSGMVMFWSRREKGEGLDPHDCTPRLLDPKTKTVQVLPQPGYNLFCSGHTFLADGRILVIGGHLSDSHGAPMATIYDPLANTWTAMDPKDNGRWYPTAVTLADGGVLTSFGSDQDGQPNTTQKVWKDGVWRQIVNFNAPPLYPRMHVAPDASVFMSGPLQLTQRLDTKAAGQWTPLGDRINGLREYGSSVMFDVGKVLFVGGGIPPTNTAEVIDLNAPNPAWKATGSMKFARRQLNATILPDGTVLVTGGTQGNGGPNNGFNDLRPGQPIHAAELWEPQNGTWTTLAEEAVDRCYHSTAVLLPDATVLSAGGGEYRPDDSHPTQENPPKDSHRDGQIFSPPYLFRGARPDITSAPSEVTYGKTFDVGTSKSGEVSQVSWIRLSSVTHSFNANQRINFLKFEPTATALTVTAPADANVCPPGHYMLFVLNSKKIPSVARIINIH